MSYPTPRDFPVLRTMREARELQRLQARSRTNGGYTAYRQCSCCGLAVDPRNYRRHVPSCRKRRKLDPALWEEWRADMHGRPGRVHA